MYAWELNQELTSEASYTVGTGDPYKDLVRLSFVTRKEMMEAARVLDPGHIFSTIVTQHATVVTNAQTRANNNTR